MMISLLFNLCFRFLISGGKDRSLYLYQLNPTYDHSSLTASSSSPPYIPCAFLAKAHKRIIWDISWITVADGLDVFATASRDGSLKVWRISNSKGDNGLYDVEPLCVVSPFMGSAVTAVDVTATTVALSTGDDQCPGWLLAIGAECGGVQVWFLSKAALLASPSGSDGHDAGELCSMMHSVLPEYSHGATVRRLKWCPVATSEVDGAAVKWKLASCGDDHSVRVFSVTL